MSGEELRLSHKFELDGSIVYAFNVTRVITDDNYDMKKSAALLDLSVRITATFSGEPLMYVSSESLDTGQKLVSWKMQPATMWLLAIPDDMSMQVTKGVSSIVIIYIGVLALLTFIWRNENAIK